MQTEKISKLSGCALAALVIMTNSYSVLPGMVSGSMTTMAHIIASLAAIFCILCIIFICEKHPDKAFFDALSLSTGKITAIIASVIFAIFAALTCIVSLTVFSRFVQVTALPRTPQIIIPLLIIITAALSLRRGLIAPSGAATLLIWFSVAVFFIFALFGIGSMDARMLIPDFSESEKLLIGACEVFLNRFSSISAFAVIYPRIKSDSSKKSSFLISVAAASAALTVISAICIATLGKTTAALDFYPVYTAMSVRGIGGFIQHTEILACIVMTQCLYFKCAVCLAFCEETLFGIFGSERGRGIAIPLALIFASLTQIIYRDISSLRGMVEWSSGAGAIALFLFLSFPTVALLSRIFGRAK